eukprot:359184-Chlamydomonas_euryale.AAC.1
MVSAPLKCLVGNDPPNFGIPIFRLSTVYKKGKNEQSLHLWWDRLEMFPGDWPSKTDCSPHTHTHTHNHHPEMWIGQCASHLRCTTPSCICRHYIALGHHHGPTSPIASMLPEPQSYRHMPCTCTDARPTRARNARMTDICVQAPCISVAERQTARYLHTSRMPHAATLSHHNRILACIGIIYWFAPSTVRSCFKKQNAFRLT